ncbi:MAG: hypothetical protein ABI068_00930 [Ktedonobacterales bacterium]
MARDMPKDQDKAQPTPFANAICVCFTAHILYCTVAACVSHFGYGTLGGIGYACTSHGVKLPTGVRGLIFGFGLFAISYLGWLPSLGILRPATTYSVNRSLGLLAAHLVYGYVTASVADRVARRFI